MRLYGPSAYPEHISPRARGNFSVRPAELVARSEMYRAMAAMPGISEFAARLASVRSDAWRALAKGRVAYFDVDASIGDPAEPGIDATTAYVRRENLAAIERYEHVGDPVLPPATFDARASDDVRAARVLFVDARDTMVTAKNENQTFTVPDTFKRVVVGKHTPLAAFMPGPDGNPIAMTFDATSGVRRFERTKATHPNIDSDYDDARRMPFLIRWSKPSSVTRVYAGDVDLVVVVRGVDGNTRPSATFLCLADGSVEAPLVCRKRKCDESDAQNAAVHVDAEFMRNVARRAQFALGRLVARTGQRLAIGDGYGPAQYAEDVAATRTVVS